jgi:hypothetical protein
MPKPEASAPPPVPEAATELADAPEAAAEAPGAPAAPSRSPALPIAIALAALFAVTTVFLAFTATSLKSDKDDLVASGGGQDELIAAAAQFTQAFVDRDTSIESLRDDVVPLSTDQFAEQFTDGIDAVVDLDEAVGLVATQATISDVFVTASDGPTAQAIVIYDARSSFADGRVVENQNQYMVLRLLDVDGTWLVDNANDLLRVLSNAGGAAGAGTTSTSTPEG